MAELSWLNTPAHMAFHLSNIDYQPAPDDDLKDLEPAETPERAYKLYEHTKLLAKAFRDAALLPNQRIICEVGPRYGKSTLMSIWGPAWYLNLFPDKRVILASYGHDLALHNARACRNIMRGYPEWITSRLAPDASRADQWNIQGHRGGLKAAGVGGALTGFGSDLALCFRGDTLVNTPHGKVRIDALTRDGGTVWAYDHARERIVESHITASRVSVATELVEVIFASGRRFVCTPDHPIWIQEAGYVPARLVKVGAQALRMGGTDLPSVLGDVQAQGLRPRQVATAGRDGLLLRSRLPWGGAESHQPLSAVPNQVGAQGSVVMRDVQQVASLVVGEEARTQDLRRLRAELPAQHHLERLLLKALRSGRPLAADAGRIELQLPERGVSLRGAVREDEAAHQGAGWARLHRLPDRPAEAAARASLQRGQDGQSAGEPGHALLPLSHEAPQVGFDTVSVVRELRTDGELVYDLTVEGASNFFADEVLVHNCDDPFKDWADAQSENQREKVWDWFRSVLLTRLHKGGSCIVLATRWHRDDLSGRLIAEDNRRELEGKPRLWKVIRLPTIADAESRGDVDPLGREDGEVLCPDLFPPEQVLAQREELGSIIFGAMHQQDPTDPEGSIFKREWWMRFDGRPEPQTLFGWTISIDTSFKDTTKSDLVVMQVWARDNYSNHFLLDQIKGRWSFVRTKAELVALWQRWPMTTRVLIEDKANGPAVISELSGTVPGIIAVTPLGSKESRAHAVSPMVSSGHVWIPSDTLAPWSAAYVDEMGDFPAGVNDDQVDATTQYLNATGGGPLAARMASYHYSATKR